MTRITDEELVAWLRKATGAIYLATAEDVADDISSKLKLAADRLSPLANPGVPFGWIADNEKWRGSIFYDEAEAQKRVDIFGGTVRPVYSALLPAQEGERPFDMRAHLQRQRDWSGKTFGPGKRTAGVIDHIRKELREIEDDPEDVTEWIDVVILALDGAWRAGFQPEEIIVAMVAKQTKNEARNWPDWRTMPTDKAIEHDRSEDAPPHPASADKLEVVAKRWRYRNSITNTWSNWIESEPPLNPHPRDEVEVQALTDHATATRQVAEMEAEIASLRAENEEEKRAAEVAGKKAIAWSAMRRVAEARAAALEKALEKIRDGKVVADPLHPESTIVVDLPLDEIQAICEAALSAGKESGQ